MQRGSRRSPDGARRWWPSVLLVAGVSLLTPLLSAVVIPDGDRTDTPAQRSDPGGGVAGGGGDGTFEWTNAVSDDFFDQSRWTLVSGSGVPPPSNGDIALFNEPGPYTITFTSGGTTHSDVCQVLAGTVTFRRSSTTIGASYALTSGAADAIVRDCTLRIGALSRPLTLHVGDDTIINNDAQLEIDHGSVLDTGSLFIAGTLGQTGYGHVLVGTQSTSTLEVDGGTATHIGQYGTGLLQLGNSSQGTIIGPLFIGTVTSFGNGEGTLNVFNGSDLTLDAMTIGGGINTSGAVLVSGAGSSITQTGASALTVGGQGDVGAGTLDVENGASFTTGTGLARINPSGNVIIGFNNSDGTFTVNGSLLIDGGSFTAWGSNDIVLPASATVNVQNAGYFEVVNDYALNADRTVNVSTGARFIMATGGEIGDGTDGTVSVAGANSRFDTFASLELGSNGATGSLTLSDGAIGHFTPVVYLGFDPTPGSTGLLTVQSGADATSNVTNVLGVAPSTISTLTVTGPGSSWSVGSAPLSVGSLNAQGQAVLQVLDGALLSTSGGAGTVYSIIEHNGLIHIGQGGTWNASGEILVPAGELRVDGTLNVLGNAYLDLGVDSTISGSGVIDLSGTTEIGVVAEGTIAPGSPPAAATGILTFAEFAVVQQQPQSVCRIEIGGLQPGAGHDQLALLGEILLDGKLQVSLVDGFTPQPGDAFTIIVADGDVTGTFSSADLPVPMKVVYSDTTVELIALATCAGDIVDDQGQTPGNGIVDIDDLFAVVANWGPCPLPCPAPGDCEADVAPIPDGNCTVDIDDLFAVVAEWGPCE